MSRLSSETRKLGDSVRSKVSVLLESFARKVIFLSFWLIRKNASGLNFDFVQLSSIVGEELVSFRS